MQTVSFLNLNVKKQRQHLFGVEHKLNIHSLLAAFFFGLRQLLREI